MHGGVDGYSSMIMFLQYSNTYETAVVLKDQKFYS